MGASLAVTSIADGKRAHASSNSPQYGPRLYANFKPTKPPADPSTIVLKLKQSMSNH